MASGRVSGYDSDTIVDERSCKDEVYDKRLSRNRCRTEVACASAVQIIRNIKENKRSSGSTPHKSLGAYGVKRNLVMGSRHKTRRCVMGFPLGLEPNPASVAESASARAVCRCQGKKRLGGSARGGGRHLPNIHHQVRLSFEVRVLRLTTEDDGHRDVTSVPLNFLAVRGVLRDTRDIGGGLLRQFFRIP